MPYTLVMKKLITLVLTSILLASCSGGEWGVLPEVLSHKEFKTAKAMVREYDSFIAIQVRDSQWPAGQAYASYLQFNAKFAKVAGEADNFRPSPTRIIDVIYDLGTANVKKFLLFDRKCEQLSIARDGVYLHILEKLSDRRDIFKKLLDNASASEGPTITGDWLVIDEYGSIDFSRADERLVFLLNALTIPSIQYQSPL